MTDRYPDNMEFEIDRVGLRRYLSARWFAKLAGVLAFVGLSVGPEITLSPADDLPSNLWRELILLAMGSGLGICGALVLAGILYFCFIHWATATVARSVRVIVEGPYLHIIREELNRTDTRLHFGSIESYVTFDGWLMRRFGVMGLSMITTGGILGVVGIKNCAEVRDILAEIDALREDE